MDIDVILSTVVLLFALGYGLFCIFCPLKVTEHVSKHRSRYAKYFYGTVFRTRVTGLLTVTMVVLVVVTEMNR